MRFIVKYTYQYFCCSTLALLNGDIKRFIDYYKLYQDRELIDVLKAILDGILLPEITLLRGFKNRHLRREYERMCKLYWYRINQLKEVNSNG